MRESVGEGESERKRKKKNKKNKKKNKKRKISERNGTALPDLLISH